MPPLVGRSVPAYSQPTYLCSLYTTALSNKSHYKGRKSGERDRSVKAHEKWEKEEEGGGVGWFTSSTKYIQCILLLLRAIVALWACAQETRGRERDWSAHFWMNFFLTFCWYCLVPRSLQHSKRACLDASVCYRQLRDCQLRWIVAEGGRMNKKLFPMYLWHWSSSPAVGVLCRE